jgi:hypothetical protein
MCSWAHRLRPSLPVRYGRSAAAPYIAPRASLPVRAQRCCAPTSRLAPRCRYGRSAAAPYIAPRRRYGRSAAAPLHRASRLAAGTGAALLRPYIAPRASLAGTGAALLRPYIAPRASLPVRAQRCCAPTSPLAPRCRYGRSAAAPLHRPSRLIPSRLIPSRLIPSRLIPSRPSSLTPASPATLRPGTR